MTQAKVTAGLAAAAILASAGAARAAEPQVHESSFKTPSGQRTLQLWADVDGPAVCVWKQFTDEAAIKASGMAVAHVELKVGGVLEEGFTPDARPEDRIRHQIITYIPERLMVLRNISTPKGLPGAELYPNIVQVISIEPRGDKTRLTLAQTGYGDGADYDQLYTFFRGGNAQYLMGVKRACDAPGAKSKYKD